MEPIWYWITCGVVLALWAAIPVCHYFEKRAERRDRELWADVHRRISQYGTPTLYDQAVADARREFGPVDMAAAAGAELGARVGLKVKQ